MINRAEFDAAGWMRQALVVLALRLQHEAAVTRALRGPARQDTVLGLYLSDDEAEAILAEAAGRLRASGTAAAAEDLAQMEKELAQARRIDAECIWSLLAARFGLVEAELDLLLLAVAPAIDPRFGRIYGYLNDDLSRRWLTPTLALRLLDRHQLDLLTLRKMLAPDRPLASGRLIIPGAEQPFAEASLRLDERFMDRLLGDMEPDASLSAFVDFLPLAAHVPPAEPDIWLVPARPGEDAGAAAVNLASACGGPACHLDITRFGGLDRQALVATIQSCLREARLARATPVLTGFDSLGPAERREISNAIRAPFVLISSAPSTWLDTGLCAQIVTGETPSFTGMAKARRALGLPAPGPDTRPHPAGILEEARLMHRLGASGNRHAASIDHETRQLAGLARPVETRHTIDDLILPQRAAAALRGLIASRASAPQVLQDWGLGEVFGKRNGMTILFKGPPGTGKTMAAGAVANALGVKLFHVDLASMVSKYIGETEKHLDRLFDAAATINGIIFFDEADAVFSERTEIQDARDRYANLQTSYLLQRLEQFDGMSILATNLQKNIDEAFLRRIDCVIEFPVPGSDERRRHWQRIGKTDAPLAKDIDFDFLAMRMELTGAEIRNCWLDAAHRAAQAGLPITMELVLQAIGRELVKQGKPVRKGAFGDAYGRLNIGGADA